MKIISPILTRQSLKGIVLFEEQNPDPFWDTPFFISSSKIIEAARKGFQCNLSKVNVAADKKGSIFDQLEDQDSPACLAKCVELSKIQ